MKRRAGLWISVACVVSSATSAQDIDLRAFAERTCQNQPEHAIRHCTETIVAIHERMNRSGHTRFTSGEVESKHHGQLETQFSLELQKGRPRTFGVYMGRGTCVSLSIEPMREPDSKEDLQWPITTSIDPDAENELHLIGWGGGESVLAHRGRHYVATYGGDLHGVAYLEWLTPAATRRGLCTFEDDGFERIVTARLDPHADCDALARTPGEAVATQMSVDLDNDGRVDSIDIDGGDSGAGCGSSWRIIRLLTSSGEVEVSQRNDSLAKLPGLEGGPVMLLTLNGKEYVYAENEGVPTVLSVTKTSVVPQCEFRIQYKRRVKTQFLFRSREPASQDIPE